jgi:hypothetical protein
MRASAEYVVVSYSHLEIYNLEVAEPGRRAWLFAAHLSWLPDYFGCGLLQQHSSTDFLVVHFLVVPILVRVSLFVFRSS